MSSPSLFRIIFISLLFLSDVVPAQDRESAQYEGNWELIETPDSYEFRAWVSIKSQSTERWLILFHDWTGATSSTFQKSELFSARFKDFNIICPDMFDGRSVSNVDEAQSLIAGIPAERSQQIIYGLQEYVGFRSDVAVVGWAIGGFWAMESCALFSNPPFACVNFYGETLDEPEKLQAIETPMLHIFPSSKYEDSKACVELLETNINKYQLDTEVIQIDCKSDFANPMLPNYDRKVDRLARKEAFNFIDRAFRLP